MRREGWTVHAGGRGFCQGPSLVDQTHRVAVGWGAAAQGLTVRIRRPKDAPMTGQHITFYYPLAHI